MQKAYSRIWWENYPSDESPINEKNLNNIENGIDSIDDRVIYLDTTKFDKSEAEKLVKKIEFERKTGIFTITYYSGATITIDTLLEKLAVNFDYDSVTQQLIITLDDGEIKYIDLSALITQFEFLDTNTIAFSVDDSGKVSAIVKEGSIQEKHLRPEYLAEIKVEVAKAQASANTASQKATESSEYATESKSWAKGGTGKRQGEDTDNAKYYAEQAKESADKADSIVSGNFIPTAEKGVANGVASLDSSGKVPKTQLPSDIGSVTGVKGSAEINYRSGDVDISPANIGLENVENKSGKTIRSEMTKDEVVKALGYEPPKQDTNTDTKVIQNNTTTNADYRVLFSNSANNTDETAGVRKNEDFTYNPSTNTAKVTNLNAQTGDSTVTFTSNDTTDTNANSWISVAQLATGITHATFFQRVSQMFKNARYLYKMLGTTDISSIGNGTVTGALSTLNNSLLDKIITRVKSVSVTFSSATASTGNIAMDEISGYSIALWCGYTGSVNLRLDTMFISADGHTFTYCVTSRISSEGTYNVYCRALYIKN